ncbi:MAG: Maf family protein [Steroidobacteraceae bacterium]
MDSSNAVLCLASVSPRRRELLSQIGVPHVVVGADIDETFLAGEAPRDYVTRLAREKALAIRRTGQKLPVLAADTTVVLGGKVFGKPDDQAQAVQMLGELSGRVHEVLTAVALADSHGVGERLSSSKVRFRKVSREESLAYWETGEPRDKAGGYAIQGLGAVFIEELSGSYSGVMGLPLFETGELLRAAGITYWGAGRSGERA